MASLRVHGPNCSLLSRSLNPGPKFPDLQLTFDPAALVLRSAEAAVLSATYNDVLDVLSKLTQHSQPGVRLKAWLEACTTQPQHPPSDPSAPKAQAEGSGKYFRISQPGSREQAGVHRHGQEPGSNHTPVKGYDYDQC